MIFLQWRKWFAACCAALVVLACRLLAGGASPTAINTTAAPVIEATQPPAATVSVRPTNTNPRPSSTPRPSATARPTRTPSETPEPTWVVPTLAPLNPLAEDVIYAEDFGGGGASLAWSLGTSNNEYATVERSLVDGAYRWQVRAKQDMFTMVQADQPTESPNPHFIYSVKTRVQDAPQGLAYGLLFYVQDSENLFYIKLTQAGKFRLYLLEKNEWQPVTDAKASKELHIGPNAENWLALERRADWMAFFINGVQQDEWTLGDVPGGFGLAVELYAGDSATIFWDDIIISH